MKNYKFYMQATDKSGTATGAVVDLEVDFPGLKYASCEGLEAVGEPKNIYTEEYAEQDGPRLHLPADESSTLHRKETTVKLTLLFVKEGEADYRAVKSAFISFVTGKRLFFWDTARHRKVWLYLAKPVNPDTDYLGDGGCIKADFEFTNLWGIGKLCTDDGTLV